MKLVIVGGHHSSALPLISLIKREYKEVEISWIGHKHSVKGDRNQTLEYLEITSLGIPFYDLKAGKLYKNYQLFRLLKIPFGFIQALYFLLKIKPDIILSFGGYLAAPVVLVGWILGIPSATHEQTVVAGYANKLISKFAKKTFISWPQSQKYFPKEKIIYSGIPLREEIFQSSTNVFSADNNFPTVYVTAGKTGSHVINEIIKKILPELLSFCNVILQCGDHSKFKDYEQITEFYSQISRLSMGKCFLRKFVLDDEIGEAYSRASLVVGRSGAHTVSELLALNKPCLLIPIPWVSHNEQNENAALLKNAGLAEVMSEAETEPYLVLEKIRYMTDHLRDYSVKDKSVSELLKKDAAKIIMDELVKLAQKK